MSAPDQLSAPAAVDAGAILEGNTQVAPPRRRALDRHQKRAGWALLLPALLHSTIFLAIPSVMAIVLSLTDYAFSDDWEWIGVQNYLDLFADERFQASFKNTIVYTLVVVPVSMALSLIIALGLNQKIRGLGFFRTVYYLPVVTSTVAVASVWLWIYNPGTGLANAVIGLFGFGPSVWLNDPNLALPSLMVVGIWQGLGAKMIVYLAALQGVSAELKEAASLDGAGRWQSFWNVTWPGIGPAHYFVMITSIIQTFQVFDLVFVMTKGGPIDSTRVLTFDIYSNAFESLKLGYASAETVIMLALIAAFIYLGGRLQRNS
jgi:ABC-type sugar transport system permease subunit